MTACHTIRRRCRVCLLVLAAISAAAVAQQAQVIPAPGTEHLPLGMSEHPMPDAYVGMPFALSIDVAGGSGRYSILVDGQMPAGIKLHYGQTAVGFTGVPTVEGSYEFTVNVIDLQGGSASHTFTLLVHPQLAAPQQSGNTVTVTDAEVFDVTDTDSIFFPLIISDAEAFHVTDAEDIYFPLVVTDAETLTITDKPDVFFPDRQSDAEGFHFGDTEMVLLSAMTTDPESFTVTDTPVVTLTIGVNPSAAPSGIYNAAYDTTFSEVGTSGSATSSSLAVSGALPTGLSVIHTLGEPTLRITGTPTATGSFPLTFTASETVSGTTTTSVVNEILVINPASQSITLGVLPTPTYGGAAFSLSGVATASSGLAPTIALNSGPVSGSGTGPYSITGAGTASFTASQTGNADYTAATPVNFNVTIAPATLTVAVGSASRAFDQPNPTVGYTVSGFVNGDPTSVVSGVPALSTVATPVSPVSGSPYAEVGSTGTLAAANYVFGFSSGALVISKAPQTITFYLLPALAQGSTFPLSARATSGLAVTYTVSGPATITNNVLTVTGAGLVTVTATQAGNGNYSAATAVVRSFTTQ